MKLPQLPFKKPGIIIAGTLLLVCAILLGLARLLSYTPQWPVYTFSDGWNASCVGASEEDIAVSRVLRTLPLNRDTGGVIHLTRTLPELDENLPAPSLRLDMHYLAAEVYLDGKVIAEFEMDNYRDGRFINSNYYFASLPYDCAGKELRIDYYMDGSHADFALGPPVLGAYGDLFYLFLSEHAYPLFVGIFLIVFGTYFSLVSLFFSALIPEIVGQVVSSLMSVTFGVWILTTFRITRIFMESNHTSIVEFTCYYNFVPLLYLLIARIHTVRRKRLYNICAVGSTVILNLLLLLHYTGVMHVTRLRAVYYVLCVSVMLMLLAFDFTDIRRKRTDILNLLQMTGPTVMTLLAFTSMVLYLFTGFFTGGQPGKPLRMIFATGCLGLVLTRFLIYLFLLMESQGHRLEFDSLTRIANVDALTGLFNRNYSQDMFANLNDARRDYCMVSLDLNHLKYVNDTFGHGKGDTLLINFSGILKSSFPDSAACCRMGGDEFLVIVEGRGEEQVRGYIEKMNAEFKALDKTEPMIPHSVAAGFAFRHERQGDDAHAVFMLADKRMYANKQEQKRAEGLHFVEEEHRHILPAEQPDVEEAVPDPKAPQIDDARKRRLDALFTALTAASEGASVFLCDMQYDYSRWSKTAVDFFDLPGEYMYNAGEIWAAHVHPDERDTYVQSIEAIFAGGMEGHDMQYRALSREGKYVVCTSRGIVIKDAKGTPEYFAGALHNHGIQSHIDPITGLRNQYGFTDDVAEILTAHVLSRVLLIGIAQFAQINDVYGYTYGSRVLARVGRIVLECSGNGGSVYRMDGARFAVVSRQYGEEEMGKIYRLVQRRLRNDFVVDGKRQNLVSTGGLLTIDNFRINVTTVASCLNFAINESANRRNGDLVHFKNELTDESRLSLERLNKIRSCISDDFRGFYLCYQYLVDAQTEEVTGAEALLRWHDDYYGHVPPGLFVPVLEQDPLFPDLGEWILRQAMSDGKRFLEIYPGFVMNVNLSYSQLEKFDFVSVVGSIIEETGFPASHLCLEVTESCRVLDISMLRNIITSLKTLGVRFALDDFGTGFSSLSVLRQIDFDVVKIDREFVIGIEEDEQPARTIEAIALLAINYGAKVCVEGVETRKTRDVLRNLRNYPVSTFQGYLYSKPTSIEELL